MKNTKKICPERLYDNLWIVQNIEQNTNYCINKIKHIEFMNMIWFREQWPLSVFKIGGNALLITVIDLESI